METRKTKQGPKPRDQKRERKAETITSTNHGLHFAGRGRKAGSPAKAQPKDQRQNSPARARRLSNPRVSRDLALQADGLERYQAVERPRAKRRTSSNRLWTSRLLIYDPGAVFCGESTYDICSKSAHEQSKRCWNAETFEWMMKLRGRLRTNSC